MYPPIEEWIAYNKKRFEEAMLISNMVVSIGYKLQCIQDAAGYLKEEINLRQMQLIEKYT